MSVQYTHLLIAEQEGLSAQKMVSKRGKSLRKYAEELPGDNMSCEKSSSEGHEETSCIMVGRCEHLSTAER